jgi:hypothetical protein
MLWWVALGDHTHLATASLFKTVARLAYYGVLGSFRYLVFGSAFLGVVLFVAWIALFVWRIANDHPSARLQASWMVAFAVWWAGLAWDRGWLGAPRYRFVGAVFVLLSIVPSHRIELPIRFGVQIATAVAWALALVLTSHASIVHASRSVESASRSVQDVVVEVQQTTAPVPDSVTLPKVLDFIPAGTYRNLSAHFGLPVATYGAKPDLSLIRQHAVVVEIVPSSKQRTESCRSGPLTLPVGGEITVHVSKPTTVMARRFGTVAFPVRSLPAGATATISTSEQSIVTTPWQLTVSGGCEIQR